MTARDSGGGGGKNDARGVAILAGRAGRVGISRGTEKSTPPLISHLKIVARFSRYRNGYFPSIAFITAFFRRPKQNSGEMNESARGKRVAGTEKPI
jgi:hypothetical protein